MAMGRIIGFGESVTGYEVTVLNEREVRAAAGGVITGCVASDSAAGKAREPTSAITTR